MLLTLWHSSLWPSPWFKFLLVLISYMTLLQLCHYFNSVIVCNAIEWESHITVLYVFLFVSVFTIFFCQKREKQGKREGEGEKETKKEEGRKGICTLLRIISSFDYFNKITSHHITPSCSLLFLSCTNIPDPFHHLHWKPNHQHQTPRMILLCAPLCPFQVSSMMLHLSAYTFRQFM